MSHPPIVHLENVCRHYDQGKIVVKAVDDLNLTIQRGEFTTLSGPSGSGKTTVLNMIGGLDRPTSGKVWLEETDLTALSNSELSRLRRDKIGFVFQAYNLIPVLTALENAEFVLALQGIEKEEREQRVKKVLKQVGLEGLEHRRPDEMSGGQQQRVAIARAIVTHPEIVLADEPTANVDSHTAVELLDLMESLNRERGITFLFSTHDPQVMQRARRLIHLRDGNIESDKEQ